jgi:two-component system response regulator RegA
MDATKEKPAVLAVDDDERFRARLCQALEKRGWEVWGAADAEQALRVAEEKSPDLILLDLRMPGDSGLSVLESLRELDANTKIIMLTGYGSIATALQAQKLGADHYLSKPADVDQIMTAYQNLIQSGVAESDPPETVPTLARVEWEHIQRILADCSGNISQAARLLGIHRRSLQRKLAQYPPNR